MNLLIHIAASTAVYFLFLLITQTPRIKKMPLGSPARLMALFASLIFLTHPLQTQGVTYIVQRGAALATLFYIISVYFYMKARLTGFMRYHVWALLSVIGAMLSKPIALTLPLMLIICEWAFIGIPKNDLKKRFLWFLPYLLTFAIIPLLFLTSQYEVKAFEGTRDLSRQTQDIARSEYLMTQFNVLMTYLRLLFLPIHQSVDYDYPISLGFVEVKTSLSFFVLMAIFVWAMRAFRRKPLISFGIFWFFVALSVESSFYPMIDVIFEHRLYLPMVGFCIFLVVFLASYISDQRKYAIYLSGVIVLLGFMTYERNKVWRDEFTLWQDALVKFPHKARPYLILGIEYSRKGDLTNAILYHEKALKIDPQYVNIYQSLGSIHYKQGDCATAIGYFKKAIDLEPDFLNSTFALGICYEELNDYPQAIEYYKKTIMLDKYHFESYIHLSILYLKLKKYHPAMDWARKAIAIKSDDPRPYATVGTSYYFLQDFLQAREYLLRAAFLYKRQGAFETAKKTERLLQGIPAVGKPVMR